VGNLKFQILKRSDVELEILVEEITPALANSLRRAMITEVPTMAIEDVEIYENSSSLYDEVLAHRLGLVPLKTDLENYVLPEDCTCEEGACPSCSLIFILDREGPGTVFSGDLQSEDPRIFPVSDDIPIVKLAEGERVRMECRARLGLGGEHAKWQPGVVSFKNVHQVEIPDDCPPELVEVCARGVFALDDYRVVVKDTTRCNYCLVCRKVCPDVKIETQTDRFVFTIESDGSLPADTIFLKALESLKAKAEEFAEKI
jgi:DNA-directed RNA polymerase subunit D